MAPAAPAGVTARPPYVKFLCAPPFPGVKPMPDYPMGKMAIVQGPALKGAPHLLRG